MENIAKLHSDEPDSYLYANNVYVDEADGAKAGQDVQEEVAAADGKADEKETRGEEDELPDFLQDLDEDEIIKIE